MSRATEELLDALHGAQAASLLKTLRKYESGEVTDADGKPVEIPASLHAQINKFLKDNGVDRALRKGDDLDELADALPEFDDDVIQFPPGGTK